MLESTIWRRSTCLGFLVAVVVLGGCAQAPIGPAFKEAAAPPETRARIYIFREDPRPSFSSVRLTLDGREVGTFRNGEYETFELSAGSHHLRAGVRSIGLIAWGWNEQRIRVEPGESVYVQLSVRLTERPQPGGRELEIAGRTGGAVSENVYLQIRPHREAISQLAVTTRLAPR